MTKPALFLDRDGVINIEKNYVHRIEDFEFIEDIFELCHFFQTHHFRIVVITNQAGIARGYYSEAQFQTLTNWMLQEFAIRQITIDAVYYCPYHPTEGFGAYRMESTDRKPAPGMLLRAQAELSLDLAESILIGDKISDIQAGLAAGVGHNILLSPSSTAASFSNYNCFSSLTGILNEYQQRFAISEIPAQP